MPRPRSAKGERKFVASPRATRNSGSALRAPASLDEIQVWFGRGGGGRGARVLHIKIADVSAFEEAAASVHLSADGTTCPPYRVLNQSRYNEKRRIKLFIRLKWKLNDRLDGPGGTLFEVVQKPRCITRHLWELRLRHLAGNRVRVSSNPALGSKGAD